MVQVVIGRVIAEYQLIRLGLCCCYGYGPLALMKRQVLQWRATAGAVTIQCGFFAATEHAVMTAVVPAAAPCVLP